MSLDMYAFSVAPSDEVPTTEAIARYRFPADGEELPDGITVSCAGYDDLGAAVANMRQQLTDTFLASRFVLPDSTLFHQWAKHPNLHAWMQRLWRVKRRPNPNALFSNKAPIGLDSSALDSLEHAIRHRQLPPGSGYFFGQSDGSEQDDDLDFITKARAEIAKGRLVYYTSWW
jgi:hypothetical protein